MTDFTDIRETLHDLLTALEDTMTDLVSTANEQRKELLALYGRMQATNADLIEFGSIVGEAGTAMLDIEEMCEDVAFKVQNVIEHGIDEAPAVDYEAFVGFCQVCGNEVLADEEYECDGDGELVCADCLDTEAEQMSINLAETVSAPDTNNQ
jgi:formylmethanofuran dehydrogenase subunit E